MDRSGDAGSFVQRSALDADRLRPALGLMPVMPDPRTVVRAERAFDASTAVGGASPEFWCAPRRMEALARVDDGNAKCRDGLSSAFLAIPDIKGEQFPLAFIPELAAWASAGSHPFASFIVLRESEERSVSGHFSTMGTRLGIKSRRRLPVR